MRTQASGSKRNTRNQDFTIPPRTKTSVDDCGTAANALLAVIIAVYQATAQIKVSHVHHSGENPATSGQ